MKKTSAHRIWGSGSQRVRKRRPITPNFSLFFRRGCVLAIRLHLPQQRRGERQLLSSFPLTRARAGPRATVQEVSQEIRSKGPCLMSAATPVDLQMFQLHAHRRENAGKQRGSPTAGEPPTACCSLLTFGGARPLWGPLHKHTQHAGKLWASKFNGKAAKSKLINASLSACQMRRRGLLAACWTRSP